MKLNMEKLITRKETAKLLGISIATLDEARNSGLISYIQYVPNGCVYFTDAGLQEYISKSTHRAKPMEKKQPIAMFVEGRIQKIAPLKKNRNFAKTMAGAKAWRW